MRVRGALYILLFACLAVGWASAAPRPSRPVSASAQFKALADQFLSLAPNQPRQANASKSVVVQLNKRLTITFMPGVPDFIRFQEWTPANVIGTDITADGTGWRQFQLIPILVAHTEVGRDVAVLGWRTPSYEWPSFAPVAQRQLERWSRLLKRGIRLREGGKNLNSNPGILIVNQSNFVRARQAWQTMMGTSPQIMLAQTSLGALRLTRSLATTRPAVIMTVGFPGLGK